MPGLESGQSDLLRDPGFHQEDGQLRESASFLFASGLESPKDGRVCADADPQLLLRHPLHPRETEAQRHTRTPALSQGPS